MKSGKKDAFLSLSPRILERKIFSHLLISGVRLSLWTDLSGETTITLHQNQLFSFDRQRFMYTHNLTIILTNEPFAKPLFLLISHSSQQSTAPHSTVSCRTSKSDFESFLAEYFSFILLDGQSYIKFLMRTAEDTVPYSFMLLRVMGQAPLLYLKLAFQANATTVERHKVMVESLDPSPHACRSL